MQFFWKKCPKCGNEHFIKVSEKTRLFMFPAYCKKCKQQILITYEPKSQTVNS